jgi:hypothetical protein
MSRDPARVDEQLVADVRRHTDKADDAEIRAALSTLTLQQEKNLLLLLRSPPPGRFGPFGWADLARGTDPEIAAAREVSGYYALLAERDALAALASQRKPHTPKPKIPTQKSERRPGSRGAPNSGTGRAAHLLALFAYHRDAPSVARSLSLSLEELDAELETLGIRRKAYRIARGTDAQMPMAKPLAGPPGPAVRRRARAGAEAPPPPPSQPAPAAPSERDVLKATLAEVGPRRALLADRLGVSGPALLARFRAAGLERDFALRERDLVRALWSKHRGSESKVAAELHTTPEELREIAVSRGIARDLESLRDRLRKEALRRRWPRERIEQVLHRREELRELGVLEGLEREVTVRAGVIWTSLQGKRDALDLFAKKLRLTRDDAVRLQKLLRLG